MKYKKIAIIIPCHNEEDGIKKVIHGIPVHEMQMKGYLTDIIVIDNNSTDNTREVALEKNARVIHEHKLGKGNAIKRGLQAINPETDYVVMLDGDNTYKGNEIFRMIEPLENNFCDVIIGSRLGGKLKRGSLKFSNRVVNWGFAFLVRQLYGANITDALSGYYAWKMEVIQDLEPHLQASGFAIEMEMITKMMKLKHTIFSVPITYDLRSGESKIASLSDGLKITYTLFLNLFWTPKRSSLYKKLSLSI